jgi:transposase
MYCWDRRDRLSVIAGLTVSALRRRVGLYFAIHRRNIKTPEVMEFIRQVQRQVGRPLVVVMDRLAAHKSAAKALAKDDRFAVEWLPGYAPDLNPVESAWSQTKYADLANYVPTDVLDLEVEAKMSLEASCGKQTLLRSFFRAARLKL